MVHVKKSKCLNIYYQICQVNVWNVSLVLCKMSAYNQTCPRTIMGTALVHVHKMGCNKNFYKFISILHRHTSSML